MSRLPTKRQIVALFKTNPIIDNANDNVFLIKLNSRSGTVSYRISEDGTYDLVHSSIPPQYQGQGLGSVLAERIFDHLVESNKKFKVTCEFLAYFYEKNEQKYKHFVVV